MLNEFPSLDLGFATQGGFFNFLLIRLCRSSLQFSYGTSTRVFFLKSLWVLVGILLEELWGVMLSFPLS